MKKSLSLVFTIVLLLTFAFLALGSGEDDKTTVTTNSGNQETTTTTTTENTRKEVKVGETLNVNELKITYDSAEKWNSGNQFIKPGDGKQFIRLHLSVANDTGSDQYVGGFECYADGEKCEASYYGDDTLVLEKVSSGRKVSGYVYFEVPVKAKEIEVEYETSLWTDKKAIFIVQL